MSKERTDIYSRITQKIVSALEQGVKPWERPWNADHAAGRITRPLRANGEAYKGINVLTLWADALAKGHSCPIWMTFKQASLIGGCVRKGEHGSPVVYADRIKKSDVAENGEETEHSIPFLKGYTVFNCEQIDGLPSHFYAKATPPNETISRVGRAEEFVASSWATIRRGGNRAYYSVSGDYIQMPPLEAFRDADSYYATLLHELTHWTGHESRLDRDFGGKRFGDEGYATEELVAELGSAFLCADLALSPEPRTDHADYISSWISVLSNDKRAIFTAAAHAQKAADFLSACNSKPNL